MKDLQCDLSESDLEREDCDDDCFTINITFTNTATILLQSKGEIWVVWTTRGNSNPSDCSWKFCTTAGGETEEPPASFHSSITLSAQRWISGRNWQYVIPRRWLNVTPNSELGIKFNISSPLGNLVFMLAYIPKSISLAATRILNKLDQSHPNSSKSLFFFTHCAGHHIK